LVTFKGVKQSMREVSDQKRGHLGVVKAGDGKFLLKKKS